VFLILKEKKKRIVLSLILLQCTNFKKKLTTQEKLVNFKSKDRNGSIEEEKKEKNKNKKKKKKEKIQQQEKQNHTKHTKHKDSSNSRCTQFMGNRKEIWLFFRSRP
jgi:preprotein translocase subunit SecD